jgi:hypothetical protein
VQGNCQISPEFHKRQSMQSVDGVVTKLHGQAASSLRVTLKVIKYGGEICEKRLFVGVYLVIKGKKI